MYCMSCSCLFIFASSELPDVLVKLGSKSSFHTKLNGNQQDSQEPAMKIDHVFHVLCVKKQFFSCLQKGQSNMGVSKNRVEHPKMESVKNNEKKNLFFTWDIFFGGKKPIIFGNIHINQSGLPPKVGPLGPRWFPKSPPTSSCRSKDSPPGENGQKPKRQRCRFFTLNDVGGWTNPFEKIGSSNWGSSPNRGQNKKQTFETTT